MEAIENLRMSEAPVREESKVACLEGLRGLRAIWVVIGHVLQYSGRTVIPLTLVVAAGCYRWVELPFINLGKRKVKPA